jgi:hypothetical protein
MGIPTFNFKRASSCLQVAEPDPESGRMHWYVWNVMTGQSREFVATTSEEEERAAKNYVRQYSR